MIVSKPSPRPPAPAAVAAATPTATTTTTTTNATTDSTPRPAASPTPPNSTATPPPPTSTFISGFDATHARMRPTQKDAWNSETSCGTLNSKSPDGLMPSKGFQSTITNLGLPTSSPWLPAEVALHAPSFSVGSEIASISTSQRNLSEQTVPWNRKAESRKAKPKRSNLTSGRTLLWSCWCLGSDTSHIAVLNSDIGMLWALWVLETWGRLFRSEDLGSEALGLFTVIKSCRTCETNDFDSISGSSIPRYNGIRQPEDAKIVQHRLKSELGRPSPNPMTDTTTV